MSNLRTGDATATHGCDYHSNWIAACFAITKQLQHPLGRALLAPYSCTCGGILAARVIIALPCDQVQKARNHFVNKVRRHVFGYEPTMTQPY